MKPELSEKVREAIYSFDWSGTGVGKEFAALGADRFVPIDYKNDWALIRRIDDAMGTQHRVSEATDADPGAGQESG